MKYKNIYRAGEGGEGVSVPIVETGRLGKKEAEITVHVEYNGKTWKYAITSELGEMLEPTELKKPPTELPTTGKVYNAVVKGMSKEDKETNIKVLKEAFKDIHEEIDEKVKHSHEQAKKRVKKKKRSAVRNGRKVFERFRDERINVPRYIASVSRWLVAKEEANVIKILLAIMNTARGEATNIMSESASASGKTHIENASFSLVHDHHHVTMNYSTSASFRNHAMEDPYMFQNKVVRFGDLGTESNQEAIQEVMGIVKILNSEGIYHSSKMAKDGETQLAFTLYGKTAMCFSKVANAIGISDQDSSRGIFYAPNPLNDVNFEEFAMWKNTPDYINSYKDLVDGYIEEIRDYMEYIIGFEVEVVNPYQKQISEILKKNKSYRRILTKELWLLNNIALLNLPNKEIYDINGGKFIYVSVEDVMNYMTLYKPDLIANSNYDMDVHSYRLWEMLSKDYQGIEKDEVMEIFEKELFSTGSEYFDEHKFEKSERFFTIKEVLDRYRGTHQLNNLISEVKDANGKLRRVMKNMIGFIGYTTIPDENCKNPGIKPTLYYICKEAQINNLINKLVMDKPTLYLIAHQGMGSLIPDIIKDFKTVSGIGEALLKKDRIIIEFDEHECEIMKHHQKVQIPPSEYIGTETKQKVDKLWSKHFPEPKLYRERKKRKAEQ